MGSHPRSFVTVTLCPTRMIAAGLVVLCARCLLPGNSLCVCVSERRAYATSPLLSHVEKRGRRSRRSRREGGYKEAVFCHWQYACRCTAPRFPPPLSLSPCLHARVLQSWNGKFLAAFFRGQVRQECRQYERHIKPLGFVHAVCVQRCFKAFYEDKFRVYRYLMSVHCRATAGTQLDPLVKL